MKKFLALAALATVAMMASTPAQATRIFGTLHGSNCVVCVQNNAGGGTVASVSVNSSNVGVNQSGSCWVDTAASACLTANPNVVNGTNAATTAIKVDKVGTLTGSDSIGALSLDANNTTSIRNVGQGSVSGAGNPNALKK